MVTVTGNGRVATSNGRVRTRVRPTLPAKVEAAFRNSEKKRGGNKTSRLDYASGYEEGYDDALMDVTEVFVAMFKRLRKELKAP